MASLGLKDNIVLALDVERINHAKQLVEQFKDQVDWFKVGSVPFTLMGGELVGLLKRHGKNVFLDLKWHDIPNTVGLAAYHAAMQGVDMLSVHSLGGSRMVAAALEGVQRAQSELRSKERCKVVGITMLTSMGVLEWREYEKIFGFSKLWKRDSASGSPSTLEVIQDVVKGLAESAAEISFQGETIDGFVCSPWEVASLRRRFADKRLITPGIRFDLNGVGRRSDDQLRAASPKEAIASGADQLVVGRPIVDAGDPLRAFERLRAEVAEARQATAGGDFVPSPGLAPKKTTLESESDLEFWRRTN